MRIPTLSIVVCGWYFKYEKVYDALRTEMQFVDNIEAKLYVASHKQRHEIPSEMIRKLESTKWEIICFDNEGWEWGAYQQFLRWQTEHDKSTDYYLFLHDDLIIHKKGFINTFLEKIEKGAQLVGNSPSIAPDKQTKYRFPEDVLVAQQNGFTLKAEKWKVVRGSCFFTTSEIAHNILKIMPIKKGKRIELANSSLRIFGALITEQYGIDATCYLSDLPKHSEYIFEEFRGGDTKSIKDQIKLRTPKVIKEKFKDIRFKRKVKPVKPGSGLKLNVGCGSDPLPGYYNIDHFNTYYADLDSNILTLDFKEESVAEIMMIHVIEHIHYSDVEPLLDKYFRWLLPGGQLILEFPDIIKVCRHILRLKRDSKALITSPYGLRGFYGGHQSTKGHEHRWGWTGETMSELLRKVGFSGVFIERARFHVPKRDIRIIGVK